MSSKRLGRGLDVLFKQDEIGENDNSQEINISEIRPNPYQPRRCFSDEALAELKESILQYGIVQPIIVRKSIRGYEIVAGERRYRAAQLAALEKVPVVVREFDDDKMMEIALIENVQRENLNPMEIATAYYKLIERLSITQEELAFRLGKSRPSITNHLRLLQLPQEVQDAVSRGTLSMGHARAISGVKDLEAQKRVAKKVIEGSLSVREAEEMVQNLHFPDNKSNLHSVKNISIVSHASNKKGLDSRIIDYEESLRDFLCTQVKIKPGKSKGKIEIEFYSLEDLERLVDAIHAE